jgi:hypothetical protein
VVLEYHLSFQNLVEQSLSTTSSTLTSTMCWVDKTPANNDEQVLAEDVKLVVKTIFHKSWIIESKYLTSHLAKKFWFMTIKSRNHNPHWFLSLQIIFYATRAFF